MFEVTLSVDADDVNSSSFQTAATDFLGRLKTLPDLDADIPERKEPGTRGLMVLLGAIVVTGVKAGAFVAIYEVAKEYIFKRYANAKVSLKFSDGSTLELDNLTHKEAEDRIRQHLEKSVAKK